jgi:16S rRNA G1207 methylase RsmC
MRVRPLARQILDWVIGHYGYQLIHKRMLYDWQKEPLEPSYKDVPLPNGADTYLRLDNKRLKELQAQYAKADRSVTKSLVWVDGHVRPDNLRYFRADNAYVWQLRGLSEHHYAITTYYLNRIDKLGLLDRLTEDGAFGAYTFVIDGKVVSRDLLDSITEIYFLEKQLQISTCFPYNILDIGAGYGRLAYRMVSALPNLNRYYCIDAVPVSTFLCEYYLQFRKLNNRVQVVPLHKLNDLANTPIELAINIHKFFRMHYVSH